MDEWPTTRMGELCEITSSKRIFAADYVSEGVPFYRGKEIGEKHRGSLNVSTELFISRKKFDKIRSKFGAPKPGDLLLTSIGALLGSPYVVKQGEEFYFKDGNLTWFRNLNGLDSRFLYYWLLSPQGKGELQKSKIGSAQPAFTINLLKQMEIELPPLPVQRRIAGILSTYDELMENSQRRIQILESMARALYREWFIEFRFPGYPKAGITSSEIGDIPVGWQATRIGDHFKTILGGTPSRSRFDFWANGTIPWINSGKVNDLRVTEPSELISELALQQSAAKLMPTGTTVLAITGATLGRVSYLEIETAANQSVVGIVDPSGRLCEWVYLMICDRIEDIVKHASGGAQQHINKEIVDNVILAIPSDHIAECFRRVVRPIFQQIATLLFQSNNLRHARDLLLPKLMSANTEMA